MPAGSYSVSIVDSIGCSTSAAVTVGNGCSAPATLKEWNVQDTTAILRWDTACGASAYRIRYKAAGASGWNVEFKHSNQGVRTISGLAPNTKYRWNVSTRCGQVWSAPSDDKEFRTLASPCPPPSGIGTSPVQSDKARLNWASVATAKVYRIRWRVQGTSSWTVIKKDGHWTKHWLKGLGANTTYEWSIKTQCGSSSATPWSATQVFTTPPSAKQAQLASNHSHHAVAATLWPNPTQGNVTLGLQAPKATDLQVEVLSLTGRTLHTQRFHYTNGTLQVPLQLEGLAAGVYLIRIQTEWGPQLMRLVRE